MTGRQFKNKVKFLEPKRYGCWTDMQPAKTRIKEMEAVKT
jgi:hypothetical protein